MQYYHRLYETSSRLSADVTHNGTAYSLNNREQVLVTPSRTGGREDGNNEIEMIDLTGEGEDNGDRENEDQVTETDVAQSEPGKEPVFHHNIYDRLVSLMSRQGAYSKFLPTISPNEVTDLITAYERPDYGIDNKDITAFHSAQRNWSSTRAHRAPILTLWSPPLNSAPTYAIGYLLFNGQLILDYTGTPIRAMRNLPLTISSAVKGFRLETWMRQDISRLHMDDILARLRTRRTPNGRQPLHKRGDLYDRANAFRLKSGLINFRPRGGATRIAARGYMDSLRTPAQRANNCATDRDLTPDELATLKDISKRGPVSATAGPRASPSVRAAATNSASVATASPAPQQTSHHSSLVAPEATPTPLPTPTLAPTPPSPASPPALTAASTPTPPTPTPPPPQPLPDCRNDLPKTCHESYQLTAALSETVSHFHTLTGRVPNPTCIAASYTTRWNALQAEFAPVWKTLRPAEETPLLFKLRAWSAGGIPGWDCWEVRLGGGEERDREGEALLAYMEATAEGGAYLGPDGTWRSVRDTWCNSHGDDSEGRWGQRGLRSGGGVEDDDGEDAGEDGSEDVPGQSSDDELDDAD